MLMVDPTGELFALTARHVFEHASGDDVFLDDDELFGTVRDRAGPATGGEAARHFHDLIARVAVKDADRAIASIEREECLGAIAQQINPGQFLTWFSPQGEAVQCLVIGHGGELAFTNPYSLVTGYYQDPITLAVQQPAAALPGAGDAGSILLDAEKRAAAVLIATDDQRYFAASLASFATRYALRPYLEVPALPASVPQPHSLPMQISEAREAIAHIREVIASQPAVHTDPDGNNIPAHLRRQLDEIDA
jgi:hypothetical protein